MELVHFSHDHPLILQEEPKGGEFCQGCGKGITGPAYSCGQNQCSFSLHKKCAELPEELKYPMHPQHPLYLFTKSPYRSGTCQCNVCRESRDKFVYHCAYCQFDFCIFCALEECRIQHKCHKHPLNLVQRQASFHCEACDTEAKDSSYLCSVCPFWIHRKCASLPTTLKRVDHEHDLTLAYSVSPEYYTTEVNCKICANKVRSPYWVYRCSKCKYFAHVKCATSTTYSPSRK